MRKNKLNRANRNDKQRKIKNRILSLEPRDLKNNLKKYKILLKKINLKIKEVQYKKIINKKFFSKINIKRKNK